MDVSCNLNQCLEGPEMSIDCKCPRCSHNNQFNLDDLLGKYAACKRCDFMFIIGDLDLQSGVKSDDQRSRGEQA